MLAERQSAQAEPDALEQATQTALRLGQLARMDERGQVVSPPARRPGRRTGTGPTRAQPANHYGGGGGGPGGLSAGWTSARGGDVVGRARAREAKEATAGKEATAATPERTPSPSPTRADAGLARALQAGEAEAALTAPAVGSMRGELLGAATPKPWLDWVEPDSSEPEPRVRFAVRA